MKKYSDWQKYVKEQTEKMNQPGERTGASQPKRQVPSIDKDRYVIHKKDGAGDEAKAKAPSAATPKSRRAAAALPRKPFTPSKPKETKEDQPANPLASPFVSVHDVWKAAEKTSRTKPQKKDTPRVKMRTTKLPEISKTQPKTLDANGQRRPARDQTREEILERLVNPTITLEEASKIMGVCKATVRRYTSMGILPHYRTPGNQRRFKLNDVIQFLENQRR